MSFTFNQVLGSGHLATDCKTKEMPPRPKRDGEGSGITRQVVSARIALTTGYGENREPHFVTIETFEDIAKPRAAKFWRKGIKLFIQGELRVDQWDDKDGNKRERALIRVHQWQFAENKQDDGQAQVQAKPKPTAKKVVAEPMTDDIPF
jgi:single-strand DNA-binding protein